MAMRLRNSSQSDCYMDASTDVQAQFLQEPVGTSLNSSVENLTSNDVQRRGSDSTVMQNRVAIDSCKTDYEIEANMPELSPDSDSDLLPDDATSGLFNIRALVFLGLWYFFSFCTLFLNKYILSTLKGDPTLLGGTQMMMTLICGYIQLYLPCGMFKPIDRQGRPPHFIRNMLVLGCMRFTTVVLGLVALKFVAVSFTETVKSSAPLFTVLISRIMLNEKTGLAVNLSLIPVMGGLALCSANELSFNLVGFIAALFTNVCDCLQNVFSKMLISVDDFKYTPAELQFYTSMASIVVEIPALMIMMDFEGVEQTMDGTLLFALFIDGLFFHFQSITAYVLMSYISPITHSVANTAKRALLIWLSVVVFGNAVTFLSGLGTGIVLVGVVLYNQARHYELKRLVQYHQLKQAVTV